MEIVTYVLEGELAHRDSTGTSSVIRAGEVQRMSAGTGISHSEFNNSTDAGVHFLQIWILPERPAITPAYEHRHFAPCESRQLAAHRMPDGATWFASTCAKTRKFTWLNLEARDSRFAPPAKPKFLGADRSRRNAV